MKAEFSSDLWRVTPWRPGVALRRELLRACLAAMLFSALQGLLGACVVAALAAPTQQVVEVCTPQGLQWQVLDATDAGPSQAPPDGSQGWAKPCAWSAAHSVLGTLRLWERGGWCGADLPAPGPLRLERVLHLPDTAQRVLLMSAMRAPPVRG